MIICFIYYTNKSKSFVTKKLYGKIAVITGGVSGLGYQLSLILSRLGAIVIIIDVTSEKKILNPLCHYYKCDITCISDLEKVCLEIKKHFGIPTILVNNAAIIDGESIETMSFEKFRRVIDVNFISHFNTIKMFLPGMRQKNEGHIVTVASSLAFIGITNLSAYCASKTALISFHESLKYELLHLNSNIQTTLVVPGQLNTTLFQNIKTPSRLLAPVLDPAYVAEKIAKAIINNSSREIYTPLYCLILPILRCMPVKFQKVFRNLTGADKATHKETSILRVCEITITMTHWTTHHECIVLSTVDPSKVTVNTENENTKYQMIEGTRSI
ncbi:hypothetical protein PCANB_001903 [Pneumocystis canis]|nr:hypothetical protein PCK1_001695 [Pneumocystis canis]KAG5440333.1 hypothetical protein PCANB_001903 [Pneumocystis canis]